MRQPRPNRFFIQAIGPKGGASTRFGIQEVSGYFAFEGESPSITLHGYLDESGIPHVAITAGAGPSIRTLYRGPLAAMLSSSLPDKEP